MKRKNFCVKALVVMLCLAFSMSCLFACASTEDLEQLKGNVDTELDALESGKVDKETYDALKAFVDEVDVIAKAAVSTENFEKAIAALNASIAVKADAAKVAEDIAAAKAALEELIDSNAAKDAETATALEAAVVRIAALENSVATKAALDDVVATINATISANKTEVNDKIADLDALLKTNSASDADVKTALEALTKTVAENNAALEQAIADAKADLAKADADNAAAIKAIEDTVKTNNDTVTASIGAINEKVVALEKADADNKAAMEKALADEVANLEKSISDNTTALQSSITALEGKVTALETKLADEIAAVNTAIDGKIAALKTELNAEITKIGEQLAGISAKVADVEEDVAIINTAITALQGTVASLQEALGEITGSTDSFRNDYQAATELLVNGQSYTVADGTVVEDMYSLAYFNRLVATIDKNYYADEDYEEFESSVEDIRFFLNRAVSVTNVIENFELLQQLIDTMPTLQQSLKKELDAIKVITVDEACISKAVAIHEKIELNSIELSEELAAQYKTVTDAYANIVAADEDTTVEDLIDAIEAPIVYTVSETAVETAESAVDVFIETYLANESYTAYYEDDETTLIEGYDELVVYRERLDQVTEAAGVAPEIIEAAFAECPLYTDYEALAANDTAVKAWIETYEIDEENLAVIYEGDDTELERALVYATAMNTVFAEKGVAALNAGVDALLAKDYPLYVDIAETETYYNGYSAVAEAIASVEGYNEGVDGNLSAMFADGQAEGTDRFAGFQTHCYRLGELIDAKAAIDEINKAMVELLGKEGGVAISDYVAIKEFRTALNTVYVEALLVREIAEDETVAEDVQTFEGYLVLEAENLTAMSTEAETSYAALIEAYNGATAEVAKAYAAVKSRLDNIEWLLKDGAEIDGIIADLQSLINMGVVDATLITVSGDIEVDIPALLSQYITAANEYGLNAFEAQDAAVAVKEAIAAAIKLDSTDINNYETIVASYEALEAWIEKYLAADVGAANGDVVAALDAIQNIHILGADGETYSFVVADEYTAIKTADETVVAAYAAAKETWVAIETEMKVLTEKYDIHSYEDTEINFVAVKKAYDAYVATYYKGDMTYIFEEQETVDAFDAAMTDCKTKCDEADGAAEVINSMIAGLGEINMDNAATALDTIAVIETLVADYEANYCTDGCKFVDADGKSTLDTLAIAKYKAEVNSAYAERIAELAANGQDTSMALTAVNSYNQMFANATTVIGAQYVHQFAISDLENYPVVIEDQPAA